VITFKTKKKEKIALSMLLSIVMELFLPILSIDD